MLTSFTAPPGAAAGETPRRGKICCTASVESRRKTCRQKRRTANHFLQHLVPREAIHLRRSRRLRTAPTSPTAACSHIRCRPSPQPPTLRHRGKQLARPRLLTALLTLLRPSRPPQQCSRRRRHSSSAIHRHHPSSSSSSSSSSHSKFFRSTPARHLCLPTHPTRRKLRRRLWPPRLLHPRQRGLHPRLHTLLMTTDLSQAPAATLPKRPTPGPTTALAMAAVPSRTRTTASRAAWTLAMQTVPSATWRAPHRRECSRAWPRSSTTLARSMAAATASATVTATRS